MRINVKCQTSNVKTIIIFFSLILLFGAGCGENYFAPLTADSVRQALYNTADSLEWVSDIVEKPASALNYYGKSFILSGPFKQEGQLSEEVLIDNIEVIEFENSVSANWLYSKEECFKGKGEPIRIDGINGCCLNDNKKGISWVTMARENYILRAVNNFHSNCAAAEYLKTFWKNYH